MKWIYNWWIRRRMAKCLDDMRQSLALGMANQWPQECMHGIILTADRKYKALKAKLKPEGHRAATETDL